MNRSILSAAADCVFPEPGYGKRSATNWLGPPYLLFVCWHIWRLLEPASARAFEDALLTAGGNGIKGLINVAKYQGATFFGTMFWHHEVTAAAHNLLRPMRNPAKRKVLALAAGTVATTGMLLVLKETMMDVARSFRREHGRDMLWSEFNLEQVKKYLDTDDVVAGVLAMTIIGGLAVHSVRRDRARLRPALQRAKALGFRIA